MHAGVRSGFLVERLLSFESERPDSASPRRQQHDLEEQLLPMASADADVDADADAAMPEDSDGDALGGSDPFGGGGNGIDGREEEGMSGENGAAGPLPPLSSGVSAIGPTGNGTRLLKVDSLGTGYLKTIAAAAVIAGIEAAVSLQALCQRQDGCVLQGACWRSLSHAFLPC